MLRRFRETSDKALQAVNNLTLVPFLISFLSSRNSLPLKLVTAAASTGVTIPGLTQAAAEQLRDTLIAVAETRRTGL